MKTDEQNVVSQLELFSYNGIDTDTTAYLKQNAQETRVLLKRTTEDIVRIGQNLIEAKARLPHGQFTPWVKAELGISQSTAWRFMQVAQGKEIKKSFTVNDLVEQISAPTEDQNSEVGTWGLLEKAAEKGVSIDPGIWGEINGTIEKSTSIEELKRIRDRASKLQNTAAETQLRLARRMGELLQQKPIVGEDEKTVQSSDTSNTFLEEEIAQRLKNLAQSAIETGQDIAEAATVLDRNQLLNWAKVMFLMDEQDVTELMAGAEKYKDMPVESLSKDALYDVAEPYASWYLERYTYPEKQATRSRMNYYQELMKNVSDMPEFHEKTKLVPAMRPEEYARLVYSIYHYGQALPIKTFKGKIIDGRMRYLACRDAGRLPRLEEWEGDESKVLDYIISVNLKRSNLTEDQQAVALVLAQQYEQE